MRHRQCSPKTTGFMLNIHYISNQSNINTIQEITYILFALHLSQAISYINLTDTPGNQPVNSLLVIIFFNTPEMGKIISPTIWNHSYSNPLSHLVS